MDTVYGELRHAMAFKGDLANISLFDVFQTLNTNRQTGVLVLRKEEVMKKIYFSPEGVRIFFTRSARSARPLRLGEVFVRRGLVTPQDIEILLMQQKQNYRPLGELLVETGKVSQEALAQTLRYHAEDEIYEVFSWERGSFAFFDRGAEEERSNTPLSEVVLDAGGLCLEAARRLDEIERLREIVPNDNEFYVHVEGPAINRETLGVNACTIYDGLEEPGSVDELRDIVGSTLFQVLQGLAVLKQEGLVRELQLVELIEVAGEARSASRFERSARLLDRAYEREPGNLAVLEESVNALERLDDPDRLAARLAQLGALCYDENLHENAIEHLDKAIHHDPDNVDAMLTLREATAATGDAERAAETSLRLARTLATNKEMIRALEVCRSGLSLTPDSASLRFHYAQLLARTENNALAQSELRDLIATTCAHHATARTRRSRELLAACYTLLLRLDPEDDTARQGLADLEHTGTDRLKRRKLIVRGVIAAAGLLLVLGVGLSLMPPSAEGLMAEAKELQAAGDIAGMTTILVQIVNDHPDSPEAHEAAGIQKSLDGGAEARRAEEKKKREATIRAEYDELLAQLKTRLQEGEPGEAVTELEVFLRRLGDAKAGFLRGTLSAAVRLELDGFIERVRGIAKEDRDFVSSCERRLMQETESVTRDLAETEAKLTKVRQRNWPTLAKHLDAKLGQALSTKLLKGSEKNIDKFRKDMATMSSAFSGLEPLFFQFRSLHLKQRIRSAVTDAKTKGRAALGLCEFDKALKLYRDAHEQADAAAREQPRQYFKELNNWIADRNLIHDLQRQIDSIREVVSALAQLESLIAAGREDAGFRLLRDLVIRHRLVQFERKYRLPYQVVSEPAGARVIVGGKVVGETPCAISMDIAKGVVVRIEEDGFVPATAKLGIADPKLDGRLSITLTKIGLWQHALRGTPEARPVMAGELVLIPTNEASILALRTRTGERVWEAETKLLDRLKAVPLVDPKHVHFASVSGKFFTVRLSDGKITYRLDLPGEVHHDGLVAEGTVYLATSTRKLVAIRGKKVVYSVDLAHTPVTRLLRIRDQLVVGTAEGKLLVHDRSTGKKIRHLAATEASSFFGGVARLGDLIVAASEDGYVYAFRTDKDRPVWRHRMAMPLSAAPTSDNEFIYLPMRDGFVRRLTVEGKVKNRIDFRNSVSASPEFQSGFLYALAGSRLVAYDTRTTRPWWEVAYEEDAPQHVAVNGQVVVTVTTGGRVLAYPADKRNDN
ncbi:MAG: outer membrane protein assembly factor BamB family protein [Planctomycetota bacterium]